MSMPRPRLWFSVVLVALVMASLRWLGQAWFGPRSDLRFGDVRELAVWAEARGLHCRSDWQDGRVTNALALSRRPLTWEQVGRLNRAAPGRGSGWQGVIWAMNRSARLEGLPGPPWDGECRVWGHVLVTGDPDFLDAIERGEW